MKYLVLFSLLLSPLVIADDKPSIQVQGNCEIKVVPDRGTITFEASNQDKDQKVSVKKTNEQINKLKEAITALKLPHLELKNSNYSVYPVREYEKEKYVDKGYKASLTLEVTTSDIARIGEAMMSASKVGITNVGALQSFLSLEKSQAEYLKCLDIAADDARNKAKQLAKKLNFKIGDVISLIEVPNTERPTPYPERSMMKTMALADSAPTQIEAGTQQFSTNIQVTFSIK